MSERPASGAPPAGPPPGEISGGEAVYWALRELGVTDVFGIVSVHNLPVLEAISRLGDIRFVQCRHEQATTHAADAYARATGRLGVAIASTGPGTTNALTGLYEAAWASSPVLLITGQTHSELLGKGLGATHENDAQTDMLRSVARHVTTVPSRPDVRAHVLAAATAALSGRPQPAAVEIPVDLQHALARESGTRWTPPAAPAPDADATARAAALLRGARRPLIWAGGGARAANAQHELRRLAERLGAVVVATMNGRGVLPWSHPSWFGPTTDDERAWPLIAEADAMLAVGTRLSWGATVEWRMPEPARAGLRTPIPRRLIHLDIDPDAIGRSFPAEVALVGDARAGLRSLLDHDVDGPRDPDWLARAAARRQRLASTQAAEIGADSQAMLEQIASALPPEASVVVDSTLSAAMWVRHQLPSAHPRTMIHATCGAIGPGVPFAVGAAVATSAPAVVIQGDGGLMLSLGELAVLAEQELPVVVLLFNDRGYGAIRMLEHLHYGDRRFATELLTPSFPALARAIGVHAATASTPDEVGAELRAALASGRPSLIDIDLLAMPSTDPEAWVARRRGATTPVA